MDKDSQDAAMTERLVDVVRTRGLSLADAVAVAGAVAPSIKAGALRDAADQIDRIGMRTSPKETAELRRLADEIERRDQLDPAQVSAACRRAGDAEVTE